MPPEDAGVRAVCATNLVIVRSPPRSDGGRPPIPWLQYHAILTDSAVDSVGIGKEAQHWRMDTKLKRLTLIIATDTEASLAGNQGLLDRFLLWRSLRGAGLVVALLAAFVFGLGGGSVARADSHGALTDGALTALSPPSVEADTGTARVVVSPDGKNVYATNRATTTVSQYSRNTATGELTALSLAPTVEAGERPEGIVVSPDGSYVYVANSGSNTVSQYSRDTATGQRTPLSPATVPAGESPIAV